MSRYSILILGGSHMFPMKHAVDRAGPESTKNEYIFKPIADFRPDARIVDPIDGGWTDYTLNADLDAWMAQGIHADRLALTISGSDYLSLCISNRPVHFDVTLPEQPDLEEIEGALMIPHAEIMRKMRAEIRHIVLGVELIRARCSVPITYLESPPPIEDNDHIIAHAGWAAGGIQAWGVSRPILRYKLWRIHSRVVADACLANGIEFLPLPPEVLNERGYMSEKAIANDVMHANEWFGSRMAAQLDAVYGSAQ
ncbi:hypothetical protein M446_3119 [Methylobacterium sp. 4-46]|nr:hypothetical protein M446_3119 [Methylobacterium sp. 4-46]